mmetsp:Transcript_5382/g.10743  ORF Transcript_5382/g.10743 Transcript_5382/m.10743 type:complete len:334 (-) Transcript_5382:878-1879(-)
MTEIIMIRHELAVVICSANECSRKSAVRLFHSEFERFEFFNVFLNNVLLRCRREFLDRCENLREVWRAKLARCEGLRERLTWSDVLGLLGLQLFSDLSFVSSDSFSRNGVDGSTCCFSSCIGSSSCDDRFSVSPSISSSSSSSSSFSSSSSLISSRTSSSSKIFIKPISSSPSSCISTCSTSPSSISISCGVGATVAVLLLDNLLFTISATTSSFTPCLTFHHRKPISARISPTANEVAVATRKDGISSIMINGIMQTPLRIPFVKRRIVSWDHRSISSLSILSPLFSLTKPITAAQSGAATKTKNVTTIDFAAPKSPPMNAATALFPWSSLL